MNGRDPIASTAMDGEVKRLERRVQRERIARLEAESVAEEGLRNLYAINRDLDRLVGERVAESERLAQEAERASHVRGQILSTLSHELRTPLMAVVGSLDLIGPTVADEAGYLSAAKTGATQLRALIDDLLTIVEIESGSAAARRRPVDVRSFVELIAEEWRLPALGSGVLLVTSVLRSPEQISLDAEQTQAVLGRLVDNAIKYSQSGTVTLRAERRPDEIMFVVCDEGTGIDKVDLESIMQPFGLGDASSTRSHPGAGLGLTIAKGIVDMLGGRMLIESEVDVGTSVTVWLPA